jgi:LmbE family N-acetylglucosaminyl deacetylase
VEPPAGTALVVAPHPDDEAIGCGGTVALMTRAGASVDVLYTTDGAQGTPDRWASPGESSSALARRRAGEAHEACRLLGIRSVRFLGGHDGSLHQRPELADRLRDIVRESRYDVVFLPWPYDGHVDHRTSFELGTRALRGLAPAPQVWLYEVWTPLVPNAAVDVTAAAGAKREAIGCHRSQLEALDYVDVGMSLSRYRSLLRPGSGHVEAFFVTPAGELGQFSR